VKNPIESSKRQEIQGPKTHVDPHLAMSNQFSSLEESTMGKEDEVVADPKPSSSRTTPLDENTQEPNGDEGDSEAYESNQITLYEVHQLVIVERVPPKGKSRHDVEEGEIP
jgi:hypothetical protein